MGGGSLVTLSLVLGSFFYCGFPDLYRLEVFIRMDVAAVGWKEGEDNSGGRDCKLCCSYYL